jgi:sigma-B regulation protein RsbU (phosphoserine phosphatase)
VVRAADGRVEQPSPGGLAIGFDDGALFDEFLEEATLDFARGDVLVLYTDGITEAMNEEEEEFGRERLERILVEQRGGSASGITRAVEDAVHAFSGTHAQTDDHTIVVVKIR